MTFTGEEIALIISRAYTKEAYEQNESILVEINADMIGHNEVSRKKDANHGNRGCWLVAEAFQTIHNDYTMGSP